MSAAVSNGARDLARHVYAEMVGGRALTIDDEDKIAILAVAFDATERTAKMMYEQGVAEEREACAAIADEEAASQDGEAAGKVADRIRARRTK